MDPLVVFFGAFVMIFVVMVLALGIWHPRQGNAIVGKSLRNAEAEAEIEANDIDQMIEARNDLRRRAGKPSIGDDLASQLDDDLR